MNFATELTLKIGFRVAVIGAFVAVGHFAKPYLHVNEIVSRTESSWEGSKAAQSLTDRFHAEKIKRADYLEERDTYLAKQAWLLCSTRYPDIQDYISEQITKSFPNARSWA